MLMSSQYCENVESWDCEIVRKLWGSCKILRMTYHPSATAAATASVKTSLPRTSWNKNSLMFNVNILLGSIWIGSEHFLTWLEDFPTSSVPKRVAPTKGYISAVTPKKPLTFSIQKDKRETCPYLCWHASLPPSEKEMDFCQYPKQQLYQYIVWMINGTWTKGSRLGRSSHWPVNAIRASEAKSKVISRSSVGTLICDLWKSLSDLASFYCLITLRGRELKVVKSALAGPDRASAWCSLPASDWGNIGFTCGWYIPCLQGPSPSPSPSMQWFTIKGIMVQPVDVARTVCCKKLCPRPPFPLLTRGGRPSTHPLSLY